jgi:hypothetical protein
MAVSTTTMQDYIDDFASFQAKKESLSTNSIADLNKAELAFSGDAFGFTVKRITIAEVKLVYGWLGLLTREALYNECLSAGMLIVERYDELNTTFQDFFTVVFHERMRRGQVCILQWNGNNPGIARPQQELIFAP